MHGNTLSNPTASPGVYLPLPSSLQLLATRTFTTSTNSYNSHSTSHGIELTHCVPGMYPHTPRLFPESTPPTRRDPAKHSSWGRPNGEDYRSDSTTQQRESNDEHQPSGSCKPTPPKPLSSTRDQRRARFKAQSHTHRSKKRQELRDKSFNHHAPKTAPAYKRRTNWRSWWARGLLTNFGFKRGMEGTPAPPFEIEMLN
jgi:hypothetical protein